MLDVVIVDDEKVSSDTVLFLLQEHCQSWIKTLHTFNDPEEALTHLIAHGTDVLILDVQMPRINGFELINRLPRNDFQLIFCTAFDQFAIEAFKASAIDYLLKPVLGDDLKNAMRKAYEHHVLKQRTAPTEEAPQGFNKLPVPSAEGIAFIDMDDILYAEAENNYTQLICKSEKVLVSKTLKEIEQRTRHAGFLRVHHSYLVNVRHIVHYQKGRGGVLRLSNGDHINVSKAKRDQLLLALGMTE